MTLSYIVNTVYGQLSSKYRLTKEQILQMVSDIQFAAFCKDIKQFRCFDKTLTLVVDPVDSTLMAKGPYTYPTNCRKLIGVVQTDFIDSYTNGDLPYEPGRTDTISRSWRFAENPDADLSYSFVYYRKPQLLGSVNDDAKVIIPEEWHDRVLLQGALLLCDRELHGDRPMAELYNTVLEPFWAEFSQDDTDSEPVLSVGAWP